MNTAQQLDVSGIGNAIVDVIATADEAFLAANAIVKGAMTLLDLEGAANLYAKMGPGIETSGGSAANSIAGIAALGGKAGFIGKVKQDQLGEVFAHDLRALGVRYDTPMLGSGGAADGPATGRCLILVTKDAQRSMNTYLGAGQELSAADVDIAMIQASAITYLEGYLWDPPQAKLAFRKAMDAAHGAGRRIAMSLSDAFCVGRYRAEFKALVDGHIDILFANEAEIMSLYETATFEDALQAVRGKCDIAVLTRSEKGSVILAGGEVHVIEAAPVARLVDTTGAGDLFAAGFLFGVTHGRSAAQAARIGALAAAEVISHTGPRPLADLKALLQASGL